jgi:hypothetical protein
MSKKALCVGINNFINYPDSALQGICHSGTGLKALDILLDRKPCWMTPPHILWAAA